MTAHHASNPAKEKIIRELRNLLGKMKSPLKRFVIILFYRFGKKNPFILFRKNAGVLPAIPEKAGQRSRSNSEVSLHTIDTKTKDQSKM